MSTSNMKAPLHEPFNSYAKCKQQFDSAGQVSIEVLRAKTQVSASTFVYVFIFRLKF